LKVYSWRVTQTRLHPDTGKLLRRDVRVQMVCVGSLSQVVSVAGWYPEDDSDSIHSGEDLQAVECAYRELRVAYASRIKAVRKKLGLTQEEAGRIIGGGRRAFQKYERGTMQPSEAAVGLIEILDRHPNEVTTLRNIRR
jgi:HTH-type transcriptional regulator/antitoxin MqsA